MSLQLKTQLNTSPGLVVNTMDEKMEEGMKQTLKITFDGVREKNLEQLRILNQAIFPINYQERVYKDILACGDITQLAYHNDVLVGAIACRLEKSAEVSDMCGAVRCGAVRCGVVRYTRFCESIKIVILIYVRFATFLSPGTEAIHYNSGRFGPVPRFWCRQPFAE